MRILLFIIICSFCFPGSAESIPKLDLKVTIDEPTTGYFSISDYERATSLKSDIELTTVAGIFITPGQYELVGMKTRKKMSSCRHENGNYMPTRFTIYFVTIRNEAGDIIYIPYKGNEPDTPRCQGLKAG